MSSLGPDGEEIEDGFRPRKVRGAGWLDAAIADGSVREPGAPDPDEGKDYTDATVVSLNVAKDGGQGDLDHVWEPGEDPNSSPDAKPFPGVATMSSEGA